MSPRYILWGVLQKYGLSGSHLRSTMTEAKVVHKAEFVPSEEKGIWTGSLRDLALLCCSWCSSVDIFKPWPSACPGVVCSWLLQPGWESAPLWGLKQKTMKRSLNSRCNQQIEVVLRTFLLISVLKAAKKKVKLWLYYFVFQLRWSWEADYNPKNKILDASDWN